MAIAPRSMRSEDPIDAIVSMRRVVLVAVVALVIGGATWALWPATRWPQAFCVSAIRVVKTDPDAIFLYYTKNETVSITPAEHKMVAKLRADIVLAEAGAPSSQLRTELNRYLSHFRNNPSMNTVIHAWGQFVLQGSSQLAACGFKKLNP